MFLFVLCYSIYKVQNSLSALAVSLFILAHSFPFVKNFFQVFPNFVFAVLSRRSFEQPDYLSTSFEVCQELFFSSLQISLNFCFFPLPSRTAPIYYHTTSLLSIPFFYLFPAFFFFPLEPRLPGAAAPQIPLFDSHFI